MRTARLILKLHYVLRDTVVLHDNNHSEGIVAAPLFRAIRLRKERGRFKSFL